MQTNGKKRAELEAHVNTAKQAVLDASAAFDAAKDRLRAYDEVLADVMGDLKQRPATKAASAKKVAAKAKPAKKTAPAKKEASGKGHVTNQKAIENRRAVARGERPTLRNAMIKVMGTKVMNAGQVLKALEDKGWAPNAKNARSYTSYMLSSNKDHFTTVSDAGRGHYKVIEGAKDIAAAKPAAKKAVAKKAAPAKKAAAKAKAAPAKKAEAKPVAKKVAAKAKAAPVKKVTVKAASKKDAPKPEPAKTEKRSDNNKDSQVASEMLNASKNPFGTSPAAS